MVNSHVCWISAEFSVTFLSNISEGECADYMQVIGTVALGLASEEYCVKLKTTVSFHEPVERQ